MNTDESSASVRTASREQWYAARVALLEKEKALTAMKDALAAERRALPWVRIEKNYVFDGRAGPVTLSELFAGRSQLFIKHFMMAPGQSQQCVGCSLEVDHLAGIRVHLEHHDVTYAVVARAPIEEIELLKRKMAVTSPGCRRIAMTSILISTYRSPMRKSRSAEGFTTSARSR
jgi:predicted dithiol-disulfide oxidoreductase (DUF899 family)